MNEVKTEKGSTIRDYRPDFAIYHPNGKGTGCALRMNLHPAHARRDGCIMLELANQKTIGDRRAAIPRFPTFDWENRLGVKLGFSDLCKMLQVFRGEREDLEDGKGLYHRSARFSTRIVLRHLLEPVQGYSLEIYRTSNGNSGADSCARILLNTWEALGIALAFEDSIGLICFGVPQTNGAKVTSHTDEEEEDDPIPAA